MSFLVFLLSFSVYSGENQVMKYVLCKNKSIIRSIRVEWVEDEKSCITTYTKFGKDREVGRAQNKVSCMTVIDNIQSNLEKAGWKCRDVSNHMELFSSL